MWRRAWKTPYSLRSTFEYPSNPLRSSFETSGGQYRINRLSTRWHHAFRWFAGSFACRRRLRRPRHAGQAFQPAGERGFPPPRRYPGDRNWAGTGTPENLPYIAACRLTLPAGQLRLYSLQGSQPVAEPVSARRLRVLRGSAADPLNLLQVMLAKGTPSVFPPASASRTAREYMLLRKASSDGADAVGFRLSTINSPHHQLFL